MYIALTYMYTCMQFSLDFIHHYMSMTSTMAPRLMVLRTHASKFDGSNSGYDSEVNVFIQTQVPVRCQVITYYTFNYCEFST